MANVLTRINNNQISSAVSGNAALGINAAVKVQEYSITSTLLANSLVYGSDLTISGNLTVNGTTTTVDTVNTLIKDPILVLADGQTSGTPTVDIGILGYRGNQNSSFLGWLENTDTFAAILSNTTVSNTTVNVTSYANFTASTITAQADLSAIANIIGTGNITGGNILTGGLISATSNITGGNILTAGLISATGNIQGGNIISGNAVIGNINVSGDITVNSLRSNTIVSATGNVTGGNIATAGLITATGNVTGGNILTGGLISATSTITSAANITGSNLLTGGLISATSTITSSANITGSNLLTGGLISATSTITSAANITGSNLLTGGLISAGGNITGDNLNLSGNIVDSGALTIITGSGNLNLAPAGNIVLGNRYINGLQLTPQNNDDAASKYYVDIMSSTALAYHEAVVVATTTTLATTTGGTITYNQPNGAGNGIGATLTTTGSFNLIDSANVQTVGTRILVKNEANAAHNGIYVWSNATVITRSTDADEYGPNDSEQLSINDYFFVSGGNVNLGSAWVVDQPAGVITFGTSNIVFAQFSQAQVYSANTSAGLSLVGQTFSAKVDNNTTAFDGGGNISVKAGANLTTPNIGAATGTSLSVTGAVNAGTTVSATGNITGGNLLTGGLISATSNITGGNLLFGSGIVSGTGNIYANNIFANISGNIDAAGSNTQVQFNDVGDLLGASANFTFDKATNTMTVSNGNIVGGNLLTGGSISATGNITGGNIRTSGNVDATSNFVNAGAVLATGRVEAGTTMSAGGNVTSANLILTSGFIDGPAAGRITINGSDIDTDFAVDGDTLANIFYVDAGTGTASFGSSTQVTNAIVNFGVTTSIKVPAGNTAQRPSTGVTGMVRFNTSNNNLEIFDNAAWTAVGVPVFTVIADEQFSGDGANTVFTLTNGNQTTNSCIVSINGVVQIPNLAYAVTGAGGNVLTFTEAPAVGDLIDVRQVTTTTTVTSISNSSGNAVVAVSPTAALTTVTGDLSVVGSLLGGNLNSTQITNGNSNVRVVSSGGNVTTSVGGTANVMVVSSTDVTITGNLTVTGNATLSGNILGDRVQNGTTIIDIQSAGGNANITVGGVANIAQFTSTSVVVGANILPTANITYDIGSTSQRFKDIWLANSTIYLGNAQISANATSLILTTPAGGQTVLAGTGGNVSGGNITTGGLISATGNITGGNILTGGLISATSTITSAANITGSNLLTGGLISATSTITSAANITGSNLLTGGLISSTGNITTAANFNLGGNIVDTGALSIITGSNGNIALTPNGTGIVTVTSALSATGAITTGGDLSLTGNIVDAAALTISTGSNGNITLAPNGTGVIVVNTDIRNGQANGTGNIGASGASFNTIFAKATSAQYADLAEKYTADADYEPGTVVMFGGAEEVTVCANDACKRVAGVISTNPSYIMNGELEAAHVATVALTGRVPTKVTGTVRKGDLMVSAGNGRARAEENPQVGTVIGKALADSEGDATIEVVVGRF